MSEHNINLIRYGEQIETDVESMNDGMFELFDDLCDMALSRVYNQTPKINNRYDFNALNKNEVLRTAISICAPNIFINCPVKIHY